MLLKRAPCVQARTETIVLVALAGFAVCAAGLTAWYLQESKKDALLSAEVEKLERVYETSTRSLSEARPVQWHVKSFLDATSRVVEEPATERWTPALRSVAISAGPEIELRSVRVWKKMDVAHARVVQIEAFATAAQPWQAADDFRRRLQEDLGKRFELGDKCKLDRAADEPDAPVDNSPGARVPFTVTATIGPPLPETRPGNPPN